MNRPIDRRGLIAAIALASAVGCYGNDAAQMVPLGQGAPADSARRVAAAHSLLGLAGQAALDSGNVLFRQKDFPRALAQYRAASDLAPQHAAPFFGVYLVARATSDSALANSALAEIKKRNGPVPEVTHGFTDPKLESIHKRAEKRPVGG